MTTIRLLCERDRSFPGKAQPSRIGSKRFLGYKSGVTRYTELTRYGVPGEVICVAKSEICFLSLSILIAQVSAIEKPTFRRMIFTEGLHRPHGTGVGNAKKSLSQSGSHGIGPKVLRRWI
jgi:hypothetical protein